MFMRVNSRCAHHLKARHAAGSGFVRGVAAGVRQLTRSGPADAFDQGLTEFDPLQQCVKAGHSVDQVLTH
jgi:hypothetical protein